MKSAVPNPWFNRVLQWAYVLSHLPRLGLALLLSRLRGNGHAKLAMQWLLSVNGGRFRVGFGPPEASFPASEVPQLYTWDHSYFSGKVRGYMRHKARLCPSLVFEERTATPALCCALARASGSGAVPQLRLPDGRVVQDSTEIIDTLEALHPGSPLLPGPDRPRQRLVCLLLELWGDEWLLVPAYHYRWSYAGDGTEGQEMPNTQHGPEAQDQCPYIVSMSIYSN